MLKIKVSIHTVTYNSTPLCSSEELLIIPANVAIRERKLRNYTMLCKPHVKYMQQQKCSYNVLIYLLISPLVVKRSSEVVFNLQMVRDNRLKWIPHLDPVKEPLTPVTLVKIVLLIQSTNLKKNKKKTLVCI